jgi:SAM-dependent methyltransferase
MPPPRRLGADGVPLPPRELMQRVSQLNPDDPQQQALAEMAPEFDPRDLERTWLTLGRGARTWLLEVAGADFSLEGKRVLDFGCGVGATLRHFLDLADSTELHGCDIHEPSIEWLRANLSPPLHVITNGEVPPLAYPDEHFDVIWGISVFSHVVHHWSEWLLELHRILKPDGRLILSYMGKGSATLLAGPPWHDDWDDDRIGRNVLALGNPWDWGGPVAFHSEWWLRAHWGRAFRILRLVAPSVGQAVAVMEKRVVELVPDDLERDEPGEPRELAARRHNLRQLATELAHYQTRSARLDRLESSRSWRLTAPLRAVAKLARGRDGTSL